MYSDAEISADGYEGGQFRITFSPSDAPGNWATLMPSGRIYFLSKKSGKIDVVETKLDGSERKTILAGTGNEEEHGTVLLASRDWKYLALLSRRDKKSDPAKLYLIDTTQNHKLSVMDEGKAIFSMDGWLGHNLVFRVDRTEVSYDKEDKYRLKSFNAENGKLTLLDKNKAKNEGDGRYWVESYQGVTITDTDVIFGKTVSSNYFDTPGKSGLYSIKPDGTGLKTIVDSGDYLGRYINYKPNEVYYQLGEKYFEYEFGDKPKEIDETEFNDNKYLNFVISPNTKETLWAESRDGKNVIFTGDLHLENGKQIASLSELKPYGWHSQRYLLLSKNGSELYIMAHDGGEPVKVTDYHKPNINYNGYGYGYGGN